LSQELRLVEILCPCAKLHEADFDFLVPGRLLELVGGRAERLADQICILDPDIQQRPLAGGLMVRDGRLVEMADIVKLVAYRQLRPAGGAEEIKPAFRSMVRAV
jgi:hypothetical protein